ncbi:MAG: hypothetical protein ACIAQZ_04495 [Sedimentisphaeraceae bacterium JB056]
MNADYVTIAAIKKIDSKLNFAKLFKTFDNEAMQIPIGSGKTYTARNEVLRSVLNGVHPDYIALHRLSDNNYISRVIFIDQFDTIAGYELIMVKEPMEEVSLETVMHRSKPLYKFSKGVLLYNLDSTSIVLPNEQTQKIKLGGFLLAYFFILCLILKLSKNKMSFNSLKKRGSPRNESKKET